MSEKKKIFSWNHISTDMEEDDKLETVIQKGKNVTV